MSESDANRALTNTARMHALCLCGDTMSGCPAHPRDPLEDTQRMEVHARRNRQYEALVDHMTGPVSREVRERRKPATVGERQAASTARDIFADRQQELIEAKLWPAY